MDVPANNEDNRPAREIDRVIAEIDAKISAQLDEILHHEKFQKLEAAWRGLYFLIERTDFTKNIGIDLVDIAKTDLANDFTDQETAQSGLYRKVLTRAFPDVRYEPYAAMIANYYFDSSVADVALLTNIARIAAESHCPFIGSVAAQFFARNSMTELTQIVDFAFELSKGQYFAWNNFRVSGESRYIGLVLPRMLLRLPYSANTVPVKAFNYDESTNDMGQDYLLWGNAAFAFAANLVQSFIHHGWCLQIRGPESGGLVEGVPVYGDEIAGESCVKGPTESLMGEWQEFELANLGFIPLVSFYRITKACFFSANSTQKPIQYENEQATARAQMNAKLPYTFVACRLAHYLTAIQRHQIGSIKTASDLEGILSAWINGLVCKMPHPPPELISKRPFRAASLTVVPAEDDSGAYKVLMEVTPHFLIEGITINFSLVLKMNG